MTYVVHGDTNGEISLGHSTSSNLKSPRLNVPAEAIFAMNLNGTDVYLAKIEQSSNATGISESALVADLTSGAFMTIYNNNTSGNSATFAKLEEVTQGQIKNRRLNSNIIVNCSQLNIVGKNASEAISNGGIIVIGHESKHTNFQTKVNEFRQGAINLEGQINESDPVDTNGTIILDGDVKVNGLIGISSWHVKSNSTTKETSIAGQQNINITLKEGASIDTTSDSNCENAQDKGSAHGIYIYGDGTTDGTINITLDGASITTNSAGKVVSAGIRIENFSGKVTINITNSKITATNGYAMYFSNCPNVTINYKGTNNISGTKGNISGTVTTNNIQ